MTFTTEWRGGPLDGRTDLGIVRDGSQIVQPSTPLDEPGPPEIVLATSRGRYLRQPRDGDCFPYEWRPDDDRGAA